MWIVFPFSTIFVEKAVENFGNSWGKGVNKS